MATAQPRPTQQPAAQGGAETITTSQATNKAAIARQIFSEIGGTAQRKDVVKRFMEEAHLTEKGAATYYQNFRKEAGLVQSRVEPVHIATAAKA